MTCNLKLIATKEDMVAFFDFDEVISIRFYEKCGETSTGKYIYNVVARIPDSVWEQEVSLEFSRAMTISTFKKKVVDFLNQSHMKIDNGMPFYPYTAKVTFENGKTRMFYTKNEYWLKEHTSTYSDIIKSPIVELTLCE